MLNIFYINTNFNTNSIEYQTIKCILHTNLINGENITLLHLHGR
jgi:hypothetical protein